MPIETLADVIKGTGDPELPLKEALRPANPALGVVAASLGLSLVGVYAIDVAVVADPGARSGLPIATTALKQLIFTMMGLFAAAVVALPHHRIIGRISWALMALVLCVLVFLLVPFVPEALVRPRNGARAWINLGVTDFQPSEVAKVAYVLVVAHYLRYRKEHRTFRGLLMPGLITFPAVALITLQPDLGTASLFVPSLFAMLVAAGARLRHLTVIVLVAALAAPAMYPMLKPHQKRRFVAMLRQIQGDRTTADDMNFQSFTAQTVVGAGGVAGNADRRARALLRYNRLPERHNDMIYAVIVTRTGLLGGLAVLGLYGLWIGSALITAAVCKDPFGRLIVVGLTAFIAIQAVVNVGMTIGLLPIVGVTLPFVSAGGSSMITCWVMTGLIYNVGLHRPRPPFRQSFEFADG
ncbi:MAG: FtsW/RodA/SpoVE family cell cycle protein [Planctomycetota bacterium]